MTEHRRARNREARFGVTPGQFAALLDQQGGCCAICGTTDPGKRDWNVDHDHGCCPGRGNTCGQCVRGLLCGKCNLMIGGANDDPNILIAAARYLATRVAGR